MPILPFVYDTLFRVSGDYTKFAFEIKQTNQIIY